MIKVLSLFFILVLIFACASSQQIKTDDPDRAKSTDNRYDESFDPLSLDEEDIVITKDGCRFLIPKQEKFWLLK